MATSNTPPGNMPNPGTEPTEQLSDRAARGAHDVIDRVADQARRSEERLRESASDVSHRARDTADHARLRGQEYTDDVRTFIMERPLTSLGIAFAAGCVLAHLTRR